MASSLEHLERTILDSYCCMGIFHHGWAKLTRGLAGDDEERDAGRTRLLA